MTSPTAQGMMWGASFATGDPRYAQRILDQYVAIANRPDIDIDDIVRSIHMMPGYSADIVLKLKESRGDKIAMDVWLAASALSSLEKNSAQHEFVKTIIEAYTSSHPDAKASAAFRRVRDVGLTARKDCATSPGASACLTSF